MKKFKKNFSDVQEEMTLRLDCKYHLFQHSSDYYTFEDLFIIREQKELEDKDLEGDFLYSEIGNTDSNGVVIPHQVNLEDESYLTMDLIKKINKGDIQKVSLNSILIPKVRPNLGKFIFVNEKYANIFFTKAFIEIKPKSDDNELVFYYLLKGAIKDNLLSVCRRGKGYPTINDNDLKKIKFSRRLIDYVLGKKNIGKDLRELHKDIQKLIEKKKECSIGSIIDKCFKTHFNYNYDEFENLKACKIQTNSFENFSNNKDLRFSSKFHRNSGNFVNEELTKNPYKKLKNFISEPIVLGASISPLDFDENGSAYFVSMATIKSLEVELDDTQLVSDKYYAEKKEDKSIKINDIIVARSGVAIGKTAIVLNEFDGIFADFTMRIRMNSELCIPIFAYYYFRSKYFQYLIEVNKKGVQNQNIFPSMIEEFPFPDISLEHQSMIVNEIENEINKQKEIEKQIAKIQDKINKKLSVK